MGLPITGPISMNDIRIELGVPTQSPFSLDTARAGGYVTLNPYSPVTPPSSGQISLYNWRGYCQTCDAYSFSYASTSALACLNNDPITVISSTIPIGIGSVLTDLNGAQLGDYYYSDGTNWYLGQANDSEQCVVTATGTCAAETLFYITNSSLDIVITNVTVNGVSLTGATGAGFPVYSGDSINAYSNQQGTHDVIVYYYNSITGQHIEAYDSDLTFYCNAIVGIGSGTTTFSGEYIGSGTFQIYALDGIC